MFYRYEHYLSILHMALIVAMEQKLCVTSSKLMNVVFM